MMFWVGLLLGTSIGANLGLVMFAIIYNGKDN